MRAAHHAGRLTRDVKVLLLDDLVRQGLALWFDKSQRSALVLWRSVREWGDVIYAWARGCGLEGSVVTVDEMQVWRARVELPLAGRCEAATPEILVGAGEVPPPSVGQATARFPTLRAQKFA